jgi:hypothetical protein
MNLEVHQKLYVPCNDFAKRLELAIKAMEAINRVPGPFEFKRELRINVFNTVVWTLTESEGQYTTRYRSKLALQSRKHDVHHEHVFPIDDLYFLSRHGLSLKEVFSLCCACIVTKKESSRLVAQDMSPERPLGWKRYQHAGIEVVDMLEYRAVTPDEMEAQNVKFETAFFKAQFCVDLEIDAELLRRGKAKISVNQAGIAWTGVPSEKL